MQKFFKCKNLLKVPAGVFRGSLTNYDAENFLIFFKGLLRGTAWSQNGRRIGRWQIFYRWYLASGTTGRRDFSPPSKLGNGKSLRLSFGPLRCQMCVVVSTNEATMRIGEESKNYGIGSCTEFKSKWLTSGGFFSNYYSSECGGHVLEQNNNFTESDWSKISTWLSMFTTIFSLSAENRVDCSALWIDEIPN